MSLEVQVLGGARSIGAPLRQRPTTFALSPAPVRPDPAGLTVEEGVEAEDILTQAAENQERAVCCPARPRE